MDIYDRTRDLLEPHVWANDAFGTALAPLALAYTWNNHDHYTPRDLGAAALLAITEYKGNYYRTYNYLLDRRVVLKQPYLAPSDTTLLRRLQKELNHTRKEFAKPLRHNLTKHRDMWAEVYRAQTNLLCDVIDAKQDDVFGVMDGCTGSGLFQAPKGRRVNPSTEVQNHRSSAVRNHANSETGVPIHRGTNFGLPNHNASLHTDVRRLSSMVFSEFEKQGDLLGHVERGSAAFRRLDVDLFALLVDKLYIQDGKIMDLLQEDFNHLGTWVLGPMKRFQWVKDMVHAGWRPGHAEEFQVHGDPLWWNCQRANWRSSSSPGRLPFWIFTIYEEVDKDFDEKEENGLIVQRDDVTIAGFPMFANFEVTHKSAPRIAGIRRRRWAAETFYKVPKHGLGGRSAASYLFPRAHMNAATWSTANGYALWRAVRQNKYLLPTGNEALGLEHYRNHVRIMAEETLRLRGQEIARHLDDDLEVEA